MVVKSKSTPKKNKSVAVVGLWHLGSVYAGSLAKMGFLVTGYDSNKKVITNLKKGIPPLFEPGLEKILKSHAKHLTFSSNQADLKNKDYIFITHDLVVDEHDVAQTAVMEDLFKIVFKHVDETTTIVISSQVPVGTGRKLVKLLHNKGFQNPKVICFPENLRLGTAFDSFLNPDRIVLGSDNKEVLEQFKKDFPFTCPVLTMGLESGEMVKHALNCYLATCVSFSSELSDVSEMVGANMNDVVKALKSDKRVSQFAPINPGLGFAGGTLGRDIQSVKKVMKEFSYTPKLLDAVYTVNQDRLPHLVSKIMSTYPKLSGKRIGILGLTYKPNTNTLRRSMSLGLIELLHKKKVIIQAFDPVITENIDGYPYVNVCTTLQNFSKDLDMIVLMTDWKDFLEIDPMMLSQFMKHKIVIDAKNFLDKKRYEKEGFMYVGIGI